VRAGGGGEHILSGHREDPVHMPSTNGLALP
jgi:hypothetical protein